MNQRWFCAIFHAKLRWHDHFSYGHIFYHRSLCLTSKYFLFRENAPKCQIVFEVLNTPLQRFFSGDREMFKSKLEAINIAINKDKKKLINNLNKLLVIFFVV